MDARIIENHIAELNLRMVNAYAVGNISKARRLDKELTEYKEQPYVKVYLELKGA